MKKDIIYWLRWIAVLPGALTAGILMTFPLHWILYLAFARNGTFLGFIELPDGANISIEYALYPFVIAITFILIGFEIAPKYKFKASVSLTIIWLVSFVGMFIFMAEQGLQLRGVLSLLGALLGLYIAWGQAKLKTIMA